MISVVASCNFSPTVEMPWQFCHEESTLLFDINSSMAPCVANFVMVRTMSYEPQYRYIISCGLNTGYFLFSSNTKMSTLLTENAVPLRTYL